MIISDTKTIKDFLMGTGKDHLGRTFGDILHMDNSELESDHEYIQWVFPLHEESFHAEVCLVITHNTHREIVTQGDKELKLIQDNMDTMRSHMTKFYGICDSMSSEEKLTRQRIWCSPNNHNRLRISRIIRSLRLFRLSDEASNFYEKVRDVGVYLGMDNVTLGYWFRANHESLFSSMR